MLFRYDVIDTVGVISGKLLRKIELAKIQDGFMDGSGGEIPKYRERSWQEDEVI